MHLACTTYLTHMHTGDRSAEAVDAGQVLPGYSGVIVRDGYAGYGHLTDALHAWCGAHLLRDLNAVGLPAKNAAALTVPLKLPVALSPRRGPRTSAPTASTAPAQARTT